MPKKRECHEPQDSSVNKTGEAGSKNDTVKVFGVLSLGIFTFGFLANVNTTPQLATFGLGSILLFAMAIGLFLTPTAMGSAELGAGWPAMGGIYVWTRLAFGEKWGFLVIWIEWASFVIGWPNIMTTVATEAAYTANPKLSDNKLFVFLVVIVATWLAAGLALRGLKLARNLTWFSVTVGVVTPAIVLVTLAIVWIVQGKPIQMSLDARSLLPRIDGGNIAFISGALLMFSGIELSAVHAGDVRDPGRTIPRANAIAVFLCAILFMPLTLALAVVIPRQDINIIAGLVEAGQTFFREFGLPRLAPVLAAFLVLGLVAALVQILGGPSRGLMIAGRQGSLPPLLQRTNKQKMPVSLILLQAVLSSILALGYFFLGTIQNAWFMFMAIQTNMVLILYVLMFASVVKLRRSHPDVERPYKIPGKAVGLYAVTGIGIMVAILGFFVTLIPTSKAGGMSHSVYVAIMIFGTLGFSIAPFVFRLFKKPSWVHPEATAQTALTVDKVAMGSTPEPSGSRHRRTSGGRRG